MKRDHWQVEISMPLSTEPTLPLLANIWLLTMSNIDICICFFDKRIAYWEALEIRNSQFGVFLIFNFFLSKGEEI